MQPGIEQVACGPPMDAWIVPGPSPLRPQSGVLFFFGCFLVRLDGKCSALDQRDEAVENLCVQPLNCSKKARSLHHRALDETTLLLCAAIECQCGHRWRGALASKPWTSFANAANSGGILPMIFGKAALGVVAPQK